MPYRPKMGKRTDGRAPESGKLSRAHAPKSQIFHLYTVLFFIVAMAFYWVFVDNGPFVLPQEYASWAAMLLAYLFLLASAYYLTRGQTLGRAQAWTDNALLRFVTEKELTVLMFLMAVGVHAGIADPAPTASMLEIASATVSFLLLAASAYYSAHLVR